MAILELRCLENGNISNVKKSFNMPVSGPVYQPTTVTYEQQTSESSWTRPVSYLSQTVSNRQFLTKPVVQITILVSGLLSVAIGLMMVVDGSVSYDDTRHHLEEIRSDPNQEQGQKSDLAVAISGAFILLLGIGLIAFYVKLAGCRRTCPCVPSKEARLARQLQGPGAAQVSGALNPSTDLLVSAQYAPVSEVPAQIDEEQRRKLMAGDNKDCVSSAEESDRMLETDPRIVLRPLSHVEEA